MNGRIWYCVNKIGMATACNDEQDALETAAEAEKDWPHMAPHRVMRLVDAAELDALRTENARLLVELEAVGAGGVQPLAPQQAAKGVEAAAKLLEQKADDFAREHGSDDLGGLSFGRGAHADAKLEYHSTLLELAEEIRSLAPPATAAPKQKAPKQAAPVPPQKPELRVGQVWRTRGGQRVIIKAEMTTYPFLCVSSDYEWVVTKDGRFSTTAWTTNDLIELISDVQKGGEA